MNIGRAIDLTGQRFGKLVVIERVEDKLKGKKKVVCWLCQCDCGNKKAVVSDNLMSGSTRSCGCLVGQSGFIDITGQKFGKLTVIKRIENKVGKTRSKPCWLCQCDCGNQVSVIRDDLVSGHTKSCGCDSHRYKDLTGQRFGKLQVIDLHERKISSYGVMTSYWLCRCDCGKEKIASTLDLSSGHTSTCGCGIIESGLKKRLPHGLASQNKLYGTYKGGAKKRGLCFELSFDFFLNITQQNCFYCGIEPYLVKSSFPSNGSYTYNGIDRVDSSLGYIIGNVVPCCEKCNRAKMAMSREEFLDWIKRVYEYSFKQIIE